jgi:hypothetical protein
MDINELRKMSQGANNALATRINSSVNVKGFATELTNKLSNEAKSQAQKGQRKASITLDIYDYHKERYTRTCREQSKGVLVGLINPKDNNWLEMGNYAKSFVSLVADEITDENIMLELNEGDRTCERDRDGDITCINKWWKLTASVSW